MIINIDRFTNTVVGLNLPALYYLNITVPDSFNPMKTVSRIEGEKQKVNEASQPLYKSNLVIDKYGQEAYDETTEARIATAWEEREITTIVDDVPITEAVQVPTEWEDLQPVMVPNIVQYSVTLQESPTQFTLEEVVQEKFQWTLEDSNCDHIIADCFIEESDLDLADPDHKAHTGVGICVILPGGQVKTKPIHLDQTAQDFQLLELNVDAGIEIYIEDQGFTNGQVTLSSSVSICTLKFVNTTDKPKAARAYAVGY